MIEKYSQIARQILIYTLLCGGVFAFSITAFLSYKNYRNEVQQMNSTLDSVGFICSSQIAAGVSKEDPLQLENMLREAMKLHAICYVEVRENNGGQGLNIKIGNLENTEKMRKNFPLRFRGPSGDADTYGTLIVAADLGELKRLVWKNGLEYFLAIILFVGAFSGGIFVLIQNTYGRHLLFLVQYTNELKLDESDRPLELARKNRINSSSDGLELLVVAINTMRERLVRNLIQRKETEALRLKERGLLVALINSIPDLVFCKDINSVYLGCNTAFEKFVGRKMHEVVGLTDLDIFPHDVAEFFRAQDKEMFAMGGPRSNEEWVWYPDGRQVLLDTLKTVYIDENGEILGLIGISRDITTRKVVENELKAAQERFEKAFNASPMMILIFDSGSQQCIDANLRCLQISGYKKQELLTLTMVDLGFWCDHQDHRRLMEMFEQDGRVEEFPVRIRNKSGKEISCMLTGQEVDFSGIECLLIFLEDLSKRERAEKALQVSECRFRDFANTAADWFWETDADLRFTYLTGKVEEVMGMEIETIIGRTRAEIYLGHGQVESSDWQANSDKLSRREPFCGFELDWLRPDGNRRRIVLDGKPIFGPDGWFTGYRGAGRDITLRKQAEETMQRSMKMDAVGQVTGGIAHDFNNILGIIIGNLDFIKRFGDVDEMILKRVEAAQKASERASKLTRQLLDFSRQQARNCQPTNINKVIQGMDSLIARSVTPEVEVVTDLFPDLWMTDIDRGDFEDVLLNLIINARDSMPHGGRLHLGTSNAVLDEYYTVLNPGLEPGDYIQLAVSDVGCGIPPEVLERIFEPFYTTKPHGKGTGLGMSMVYAFTQRSKGSVRVYSEPGAGSTVHIYLPRTIAKIQEGADRSLVIPGLPGGNETILIVDDEVDLLALATDMLKILGYTTLTAKNGNEAIVLLLEKGTSVDLLFTDVVMPGGMNGFELAEQALLLDPNLKVLFTSGYIEKAVPQIGQFSFSPQIIFKPYNELDLAIRISEVLHG